MGESEKAKEEPEKAKEEEPEKSTKEEPEKGQLVGGAPQGLFGFLESDEDDEADEALDLLLHIDDDEATKAVRAKERAERLSLAHLKVENREEEKVQQPKEPYKIITAKQLKSMFRTLRIQLPQEVMEYLDYALSTK